MSTSVGSIHYDLGLNTKKFDTAAASVGGKLKTIGASMSNVGRSMTVGITLPAALMGAALLKSASDLEKTASSFNVLIGNTKKAQKLFAEVKRFADTTPFEFPELAKSTTMLLGYGVTAEDVMDRLKRLGDAAAASGGDLNGITLAYAQMVGRGKVTGDNLRQLTENMVTLRAELSKVSGVPMKELDKAIENGEISTAELNKALDLATNKGGKFFGGTAKLAQTFSGRLSTLKDTLYEAGRNLLGLRVDPKLGLTVTKGGIFDRLTELLPKISKFAKDIGDGFSKLSPQMQNMVVAGGLLVIALGPLLMILGPLTTIIGTLIPLLMNPAFWIVAGVLTAIAGVAYLVWKNWEKIKPQVDTVVTSFNTFMTVTKPIRDFLANQWKLAMEDMRKAWIDVQVALRPYMPMIEKAGKLLIMFSVGALVTLVIAIAGVITVIARLIGWFSRLQAGASKVASSIVSWFMNLDNRIRAAVAGFGNLLYNAGVALLNGLSNGITSRINGIIGTIRSMADSVKNAFESVLNIHSPSRVFYDYGKNITQGLINGMNSRAATVKVATENMAGTVAGAGKNVSTTSSDFKVYGNINIGDKSDANYWLSKQLRASELSSMGLAGG